MEGPEEMRSLMSKWREHWETRDQIFVIHPERANQIGVGFFWCFTLSLMYSCLQLIIPRIGIVLNDQDVIDYTLFLKITLWIMFLQTVGNWCLCARHRLCRVTSETVPQTQQTSSVLGEIKYGWKACPICQLDAPPRSHHCKVCGFCVLKRDHHCFFSGTCIGFFNQRYFIVWLFYVMAASLYIFLMMASYLREDYPLLQREGFNFLLPVAVWSWFSGYMSGCSLILFIQLYLTAIIIAASAFFFFWEMCMVYRGQTTYEATRNYHVFRTEPISHFRSVFGSFWILNFIAPMPSKQEGDGITWKMHKTLKGN